MANSRLGFALGVGAAFIPLLGIPARFMWAELSPWVTYGGAFLLGVVPGLLFAPRSARLSPDDTSESRGF